MTYHHQTRYPISTPSYLSYATFLNYLLIPMSFICLLTSSYAIMNPGIGLSNLTYPTVAHLRSTLLSDSFAPSTHRRASTRAPKPYHTLSTYTLKSRLQLVSRHHQTARAQKQPKAYGKGYTKLCPTSGPRPFPSSRDLESHHHLPDILSCTAFRRQVQKRRPWRWSG